MRRAPSREGTASPQTPTEEDRALLDNEHKPETDGIDGPEQPPRSERAEQALRASEERYAAIFDKAPFAIALTDETNGATLSVNDAFLRLFEYTREEVLGRTSRELHITDPESYSRVGAEMRQNGRVRDFECTRLTRSGARLALSLCVERTSVGGRPLVLTTIQDITARKQAEDRLTAERERLAVTLHSIGDAVIATDVEARITVFNGAAEALTGWTAADALGRPLHEVFRIVHEETGEPVTSPVDKVLREGVIVGLANHTALIARDGSERPIADSGAPIRDPEGRITGVVLVFRDQTGERAAERMLRASEARFRALFEQAAMGVALLETRTGRFLEVNESFAAMLGYTRDELRRTSWETLTHPDDLPLNRVGVQRMEARREPYRCEKRYLAKDGSIVWTRLTVSPVNEENETLRMQLAIVEDITEQRRVREALLKAEERFHQAQKLESVGRLAGGVAHDFNNLLTVILSYTEMMREALADGGAASAEDLNEIHAAGVRARDLTRQLLAFARKQVIAPISLDLNAVVRDSQRMLQRLLGEDIDLRVSLEPGLWLVHADPSQVEQVLMNLAVNARDAMARGGTLTIETHNTTTADADEDTPETSREWAQLTVRDSGSGMSPEVMAHLFEPFFTTKEQGRGTGLGLATVYGIVQQAHGLVHAESAPGQGTTFHVRLPRTQVARPPSTGRRPAAPRGGSEGVLLVEDEPQVREVTARALRAAGYTVTTFPTPQAALGIPTEELRRIRLLVTDVVMPGLDGRALSDELCKRHPGLRALYVSGYTQDAIAVRGVLDAGIEFLAKPFEISALLSRIRAILDPQGPA